MVADADEITEKISEYGTLDEEEVRKIKEANEKREQAEATDNGADQETDLPLQAPERQSGGDAGAGQEPAETGRFVICPKCGVPEWTPGILFIQRRKGQLVRSAASYEPCKPGRNRHEAAYRPIHRRRSDFPMHGGDHKSVEKKVHDDGGKVRMVLRRGETFQLFQRLVE